jgi:Fic family protein
MPLLRKKNRIKTIQSSLAIENNSLSIEQVTAILEGKRVLGPPNEIQEVRNAIDAYELLLKLNPYKEKDLLKAHRLMMNDLVKENGRYRTGGVGVFDGKQCIHLAPPAQRVPQLMSDLLSWVKSTKVHPLISICVFHYEFEFIHPFSDGNCEPIISFSALAELKVDIGNYWRNNLAFFRVLSLLFNAKYYLCHQ